MGDIFQLIAAFLELGSLFDSFIQTKHKYELEQAFHCMKRLDQDPSQDAARSALLYLNKIDSDDKLYAQALACKFRVYCYTFLFEFDKANSQIKALSAIEIGWLTLNKDAIRSLQSEIPQLKQMVAEAKQMYEELVRKQRRIERANRPFNWKVLSIALIVVVAVLAVLLIFL